MLRGDVLPVLVIAAVLGAPFVLFDANFFGPEGFFERFGSFASVLTGFYIAALVGIASFVSAVGGLDEPIMVGPVFTKARFDEMKRDDSTFGLTRA